MDTSDPHLTIVAPTRRGRPRNPETSTTVSTWLGEREHDRLIAIAARDEASVSATVRKLLVSKLNEP